MVITA